MKQEIEVKYLIGRESLKEVLSRAESRLDIVQGYFGESLNIRVRNVIDGIVRKSKLTIKGKLSGKTREEFEYDIPYEDGVALLERYATAVIYKTRYIVKNGENDIWEIDDFHGRNAGLTIAELEITHEDYEVKVPKWIGEWINVTEDKRYYNFYIANNPYDEWYPEEEDDEG